MSQIQKLSCKGAHKGSRMSAAWVSLLYTPARTCVTVYKAMLTEIFHIYSIFLDLL